MPVNNQSTFSAAVIFDKAKLAARTSAVPLSKVELLLEGFPTNSAGATKRHKGTHADHAMRGGRKTKQRE